MISFVIRTKNEEKSLEKVLEAIESQNGCSDIEVILVDSGSTDNTIAIAEAHNCKIIRISPSDFSWGYALNMGIKNASGDIIAVISGHCILIHEHCLNMLEKKFAENHSLQVIYGRQSGRVEDDPFEYIDNLKYYPNECDLKSINKNFAYETTISNACAFFRKECWEKIKFDETVQSCEDAMWAKELKSAGIKLAYYGAVGVFHSHPINVEYLYKKSYCREYEMEHIRNSPKRKVFYFLKHLIKRPLLALGEINRNAQKYRIEISLKTKLQYIVCVNYAQYRASCDFTRGVGIEYVSVKPPKWMKHFFIQYNGGVHA